MPERIPIRDGATESVVWFGRGLLDEAAARLESPSGRYVLVSSAGSRATADRIRNALSGRILADVEIADDETAKTLEATAAIAGRALESGVRRDDAVVAVGGGVVTDIAGFAAAIVLRGSRGTPCRRRWGMADAAIGLKTGVDIRCEKPSRAFHPRGACSSTRPAATLPDATTERLVEAFRRLVRDPNLSRRSFGRRGDPRAGADALLALSAERSGSSDCLLGYVTEQGPGAS